MSNWPRFALALSVALPFMAGPVEAAQYTTWNPSDKSGVVLSNGNLTATAGINTGVRTVNSYSSGKYYFEYTMSTWTGTNTAVGMALSTASISSLNAVGWAWVTNAGAITVNNVNSGYSLGARASGNVIGVAVDFGAGLIWFRVAPAGTWNGNGTANPATGTNGASISALVGPLFGGLFGGQTNEVCTANFGASAFSGAVPSGFTAGLPVGGGGAVGTRGLGAISLGIN